MEDLTDLIDIDDGMDDGVTVVATTPDYKNSRYINYNRWSLYEEVDSLVDYMVIGMNKRKADSYRMNMKVIILDLYDSYLSDPEQYIGYHRGNDHYNFKLRSGQKNQYMQNRHIAKFSFVGSVDYLIDNGYASHKNGGHFYNEVTKKYYGLLSKMMATKKLIVLCDVYKLTPRMIGHFWEEEVIILKDKPVQITINGQKKKVKEEVQYSDTPKIVEMRSRVQEYNCLLDKFHIDSDVECMTDADREQFAKSLAKRKKAKREKIRLGDKHVYRVFNNNSFEQGGRYYGAWWGGCPSLLRKYITINGSETVELDYSGIHVQLLYAMKGVNYEEKKEDAYSLIDNDPDRKLNKLILLTAFNADGEKPTAQSIYSQLVKNNDLVKYNISSHEPIKAKLQLLREKHPLISDCIAEGYGITLQYHDSCIIEKLIEYAVKYNIPILTIHDSVICQDEYADFIRDKMWQYYRDYIANKFGINIKYNSIQPNAKPFFKEQLKIARRVIPKYDTISAMSSILGMGLDKYKYHHGMYGKNTIIKVKEEARDNSCNKECNHNKRVNQFRAAKYVYLKDVTIKLLNQDCNDMSILID